MDALSLAPIAEFGRAEMLRGNGETRISRVAPFAHNQTRATFRPWRAKISTRIISLEQLQKQARPGRWFSGGTAVESAGKFCNLYAPPTRWLPIEISPPIIETLPLKVLGITGSNGKTSTKTLLPRFFVLFRVTKTEGNFNITSVCPAPCWKANRDDRFRGLELGMNHPGEIAALARIASADAAIITTSGSRTLSLWDHASDCAGKGCPGRSDRSKRLRCFECR